ncbi:MAG: polysaccharide deacetylase family protein [Planctomycetota bacterium]|nr:polysaccharide deacetylase family protein [Planctomycetota bacterium]
MMIRQPRYVPVLCFHRVLPAEFDAPLATCHRVRGLVVEQEVFREQMRRLDHLLQPVGLKEYLAWLRGEAALPPNACLVTFDDGFRDLQEVALPILAEMGFPVTAFVSVLQSEQPQRAGPIDLWFATIEAWWHRSSKRSGHRRRLKELVHGEWSRAYLRALPEDGKDHLERLGRELGVPADTIPSVGDVYLDTAALRSLAGYGVDLASHGWDHVLLTTLGSRELAAQLESGLAWIRMLNPRADPVLAYPNGSNDRRVQQAVEAAGFCAAFSVLPKKTLPDGPFAIPRYCIPNRITAIDEVAEGMEVRI